MDILRIEEGLYNDIPVINITARLGIKDEKTGQFKNAHVFNVKFSSEGHIIKKPRSMSLPLAREVWDIAQFNRYFMETE